MTLAYVDTSCLVAVAFAEPDAGKVARRLGGFDRLFSSDLLEAELRSALARERVPGGGSVLMAGITWIHPNRPLTPEFDRVLATGYLKGADIWHLACALFLTPDARHLAFVTLDRPQREVATKLGFS